MSDRSIITIGNFDGVHLGHRSILRRARELAEQHSLALKAITFEPHPITVLRPQQAPPRLSDAEEKVELLRDAGVDEVLVLEPTQTLLAEEPEDFIGQLVRQHHPLVIVEGPDFRFGHNRRGDAAILESLGDRHGFTSIAVPRAETVLTDQLIAPVSSSTVRWLLGQGRVADAAICLARPYVLSADVAKGEQRGRTLGTPTANLDMTQLADRMLPADAVYAGHAVLPDGQTRPAAISVGVKPTFGCVARLVEAYLLGFDGDLYGRRLTLRFDRWLRDQQPFPSLDELRRQIQRDVEQVRYLEDAGLLRLPARKERLAG